MLGRFGAVSARLLPRAIPPRAIIPQHRGLAKRAMAFRGPVQEHIEQTLAEALEPDHLEVTNESHRMAEDESHFHVLVVSDKFEGTPLIKRHRAVSALFTDENGALKFHSLRITAKTSKQWSTNSTVPVAPKCSGKGDGRAPTDTSKLA
eukprot:TRINITY_DN1833_c0_g1_i1.p2 TRINITY_DN1833_c0_g1~~TRINITY_DN1833_c0_g1_i1.p2  ORF type:complete len:149 (+),score=24.62 TRINITY_DN1833_c0_g1_i1:39-485(+)